MIPLCEQAGITKDIFCITSFYEEIINEMKSSYNDLYDTMIILKNKFNDLESSIETSKKENGYLLEENESLKKELKVKNNFGNTDILNNILCNSLDNSVINKNDEIIVSQNSSIIDNLSEVLLNKSHENINGMFMLDNFNLADFKKKCNDAKDEMKHFQQHLKLIKMTNSYESITTNGSDEDANNTENVKLRKIINKNVHSSSEKEIEAGEVEVSKVEAGNVETGNVEAENVEAGKVEEDEQVEADKPSMSDNIDANNEESSSETFHELYFSDNSMSSDKNGVVKITKENKILSEILRKKKMDYENIIVNNIMDIGLASFKNETQFYNHQYKHSTSNNLNNDRNCNYFPLIPCEMDIDLKGNFNKSTKVYNEQIKNFNCVHKHRRKKATMVEELNEKKQKICCMGSSICNQSNNTPRSKNVSSNGIVGNGIASNSTASSSIASSNATSSSAATSSAESSNNTLIKNKGRCCHEVNNQSQQMNYQLNDIYKNLMINYYTHLINSIKNENNLINLQNNRLNDEQLLSHYINSNFNFPFIFIPKINSQNMNSYDVHNKGNFFNWCNNLNCHTDDNHENNDKNLKNKNDLCEATNDNGTNIQDSASSLEDKIHIINDSSETLKNSGVNHLNKITCNNHNINLNKDQNMLKKQLSNSYTTKKKEIILEKNSANLFDYNQHVYNINPLLPNMFSLDLIPSGNIEKNNTNNLHNIKENFNSNFSNYYKYQLNNLYKIMNYKNILNNSLSSNYIDVDINPLLLPYNKLHNSLNQADQLNIKKKEKKKKFDKHESGISDGEHNDDISDDDVGVIKKISHNKVENIRNLCGNKDTSNNVIIEKKHSINLHLKRDKTCKSKKQAQKGKGQLTNKKSKSIDKSNRKKYDDKKKINKKTSSNYFINNEQNEVLHKRKYYETNVDTFLDNINNSNISDSFHFSFNEVLTNECSLENFHIKKYELRRKRKVKYVLPSLNKKLRRDSSRLIFDPFLYNSTWKIKKCS